jgi:thiamine biosynthesis lipoprotein
MSVDLGGIGKGWIVDRAVERVRGLGVESGAILSGRSTIVVWGEPPEGGAWRVGIADPRDAEIAFLELEAEPGAVSTSAAYERQVWIGGAAGPDRRAIGHILDPRSGRPARRCLSATVWTPDATSGDVASTALFVLGAADGAEVLPALGRASAILVEEDPGAWGGVSWRRIESGDSGLRAVSEA